MLKKNKINLNEISHNSAIDLVKRALNTGFFLQRFMWILLEILRSTGPNSAIYFPSIKFVVAKKADSLYPVVSGASIVAKVTRDRALRNWVFDENAENMHRNFGSGYPGELVGASQAYGFWISNIVALQLGYLQFIF